MITTINDLVDYLRSFHRSWLESPDLDPATVPDDLPNGLALIYRELGALVEIEPSQDNEFRTPFATQDGLMPLSRLERVDGMVEFAWENQGNWSCRSPLGQADPPVYSNAAQTWSSDKSFQKVCDSLNHFLITLCLQEAVMSAPCLLATDVESVADFLTVPFQPLWRFGYYVFGEPTHDFYEVPDRDILIMMNSTGTWLASHAEGILEVVKPDVEYEEIN